MRTPTCSREPKLKIQAISSRIRMNGLASSKVADPRSRVPFRFELGPLRLASSTGLVELLQQTLREHWHTVRGDSERLARAAGLDELRKRFSRPGH